MVDFLQCAVDKSKEFKGYILYEFSRSFRSPTWAASNRVISRGGER